MIFEYNQELQVLKGVNERGVTSTMFIAKQDLERLYFMLWVLLQDNDSVQAEYEI
jgi:hypothetical protein